MILTDIRKYLSERNIVSLQDLSLHFKIDPDAMQGMLEHWVRKAKVKKVAQDVSCTGCCKACTARQVELYQWRKQERIA